MRMTLDPLSKLFLVSVGCGAVGSILGLLFSLFGRTSKDTRAELTMGVGFLVGASMGALYGIFATMLDRL